MENPCGQSDCYLIINFCAQKSGSMDFIGLSIDFSGYSLCFSQRIKNESEKKSSINQRELSVWGVCVCVCVLT